MKKSSLTNIVVEADSSNYSKGRSGYKVCKITPHHMAGVLSAEQCGKIFQKANRNASANYGIGNDGKIACYVSEENRAWTSSSKSNDCQAITIEVSNCETGGSWRISETAWKSLVNLCVDICKRYGFKLNYDGTKNGSLTRHNMFANTACPGPYLQGRFQELVDTVNAKLSGNSNSSTSGIIAEWQKAMNNSYKCGLAVDNKFGPDSQSKAKKYQLYLKNPQMHNDYVLFVQKQLNKLGYGLKEDGFFGPSTSAAVKKYQKSKGLKVDGYVGLNTITKILKG